MRKIRRGGFFPLFASRGVQARLCEAQHHLHVVQHRAPYVRKVTERDPSLQSGRIDSVQNPEASFVILKRGSES